MKAKRINIGREREKKNDTSGENRQNRCIKKNAKTHNSGKIAREEKCINEKEDVKEDKEWEREDGIEDVRERHRTGERRKEREREK